jgi:hypothetical protein
MMLFGVVVQIKYHNVYCTTLFVMALSSSRNLCSACNCQTLPLPWTC